jgi:hypothetical protein
MGCFYELHEEVRYVDRGDMQKEVSIARGTGAAGRPLTSGIIVCSRRSRPTANSVWVSQINMIAGIDSACGVDSMKFSGSGWGEKIRERPWRGGSAARRFS